jgi:hypothetical protein
MILNTGKKKYEVMREVFTGDVNDVYVCQDAQDRQSPYKTVWIVKERRIAKALVAGMAKSGQSVCEEYFTQNENMGFVLPYVQERPLYRFYVSNIEGDGYSRQNIWLDIITQCMTKKLPDEVINLILKQGQIQIAPDGSIEFSYFFDLSEYDFEATEKDNVALCAQCILELIHMESRGSRAALTLLEKKLKRSRYIEFIQLYKDVKIIMQDNSETGKVEKAKKIVVSNSDRIYKILSVLCIILLCIVIIKLLGNLFLKDFSFWKLFGNSLKQIGTESLLN